MPSAARCAAVRAERADAPCPIAASRMKCPRPLSIDEAAHVSQLPPFTNSHAKTLLPHNVCTVLIARRAGLWHS